MKKLSGSWLSCLQRRVRGQHDTLAGLDGRGFRALKQLVKLCFRQGRMSEMLERYRELLGYVRAAVTRNQGEKGITSILDIVSHSDVCRLAASRHPHALTATCAACGAGQGCADAHVSVDPRAAAGGQERGAVPGGRATLAAAAAAAGADAVTRQRLWFKTNLSLGQLLLETEQFARLSMVGGARGLAIPSPLSPPHRPSHAHLRCSCSRTCTAPVSCQMARMTLRRPHRCTTAPRAAQHRANSRAHGDGLARGGSCWKCTPWRFRCTLRRTTCGS